MKNIKLTPEKLTACVLDRPRHSNIVNSLKNLKVNINFITDGDVSGAISVIDKNSKNDIYIGTGGGPEGVLAAAALDSYNCHFQGRFIFDNNQDIQEAKRMGINDLNKKYELSEIVKGDSIFCATGITDSKILKGIKLDNNKIISQTLVTHKSSNLKKIIKKVNLINE